jgi:SAM-dependent methyltransferase
MIEISKCPICNSSSFSEYLETEDYFFTKEKFSLSKCDSCDFVFTNPVPSFKEIGAYYATEKYYSHNSKSKGIISSIYSGVREVNLKNKYKIVSEFKDGGSILDIGCGTGEFLNYGKKKSWKVKGIEPNENARKFIQDNYGIDVEDEPGLKTLKNNSFDVVSMWHVLEHVYDLNDRMQSIKNLLKDDGVAIIALPMIDSPDSKKFGKHWAGLDVPRHLHHFSSATFEKLADRNSFIVVNKFPMKFDSFYVSWLSYQARKNSFAFPMGLLTGLISNLKANAGSNYSSMIFVLKKSS